MRHHISPPRVEQLTREGLDESRPGLTGGEVGGHSVTQPINRDVHGDSDGGDMGGLTRTGADEGGSQYSPRLPTDDELDLTMSIVTQEGSSSSRGIPDLGGDSIMAECLGPLFGRIA